MQAAQTECKESGNRAPDNRLAEKGWITRKNTHGDTEWLPPAHLDHGQPRINTFHHPEKLLHNDEDNDDDP